LIDRPICFMLDDSSAYVNYRTIIRGPNEL
jgi:hypothetical protein